MKIYIYNFSGAFIDVMSQGNLIILLVIICVINTSG